MKNSYCFFANKECEWFPCHSLPSGKDVNDFSCLFCYCPLSPYDDCGGDYTMLDNGWKDCSNCTIPHFNYDYIIAKLREEHDNERY